MCSISPLAEGKKGPAACSMLFLCHPLSLCWACPLALLQVAQPLLSACVVQTFSPSHCWHSDKASSAAAARTQLNYNAWPGQQHPELQNTPVIPQHDTRPDWDSSLDFLSEIKIEPLLSKVQGFKWNAAVVLPGSTEELLLELYVLILRSTLTDYLNYKSVF